MLAMFLTKLNSCVAYLMGCPIRGVILDPFVALRMGIQGQVYPLLISILGNLSIGPGILSIIQCSSVILSAMPPFPFAFITLLCPSYRHHTL